MKRILKIFTILLLIVPIMVVKAENLICDSKIKDNRTDLIIECEQFTSCDNLTYKDEKDKNSDYKDYFSCNTENNATKLTIKSSLKFDTSKEVGHVIISNGTTTVTLYIKNQSYVKTTTSQTTTTTKAVTTTVPGKTYTVTLDPNNGEKTEIKTCTITGTNETCMVTLPTREDTKFTGWGKAKTCTTGNTGSVKVNEDITYYACYNTSTNSAPYLNSLKLTNNNKTINIGTFSKKKNEYNAKVLYDVENIDVLAESDEGIIVVTEGNENLNVGENKITITLTGKDNETNTYVVNVTRLKKGEAISNINYLKSLVIGGNYNINFNKETFTYNLKIDSDVNRLEITPVAEDETITPEIRNNENLKNGSVIQIGLKSENGNETIYKINIIKDNKTTLILFGAAAVIILLIILLIIMIIIKSNKKRNGINTKGQNQDTTKNKKDEEIEILDL